VVEDVAAVADEVDEVDEAAVVDLLEALLLEGEEEKLLLSAPLMTNSSSRPVAVEDVEDAEDEADEVEEEDEEAWEVVPPLLLEVERPLLSAPSMTSTKHFYLSTSLSETFM